MPETRAKWTDLIPDTGLKISDLFDQGDLLYTPGISNVLIMDSGDVAQKNFTGKTGFTRLQKFGDGDDIPTSARYKTYTTRPEYINYGEAVEVTKNQIEDRDFDAELDEMKDMSRVANLSVDESGIQLFNGGFATTVVVNGYDMTWYGDAVPLFSTIHPTVVPGASTQSNASSTGVTLGVDNYEIGKLALQKQQTDNGLPLSLVGRVSINLPLELEREGLELFNSDLTPENANNALNVYKGQATIVTTQFLDSENGGSATAWYLTLEGRHKLYHDTRQEKTLDSDVNIRNKVVTFTVDARWMNYVKDWRGTWATKGDGTSYSS